MILILGSSGYFGSQFIKEIQSRNLKYAWLKSPSLLSNGDYDVTGWSSILTHIKNYQPTLVLNCAAYVDPRGVDYNEQDREQTLQANLLLPTMLAHACEVTDTPLMHLSTACLYQGDNGGHGWTEDDAPHLNVNTCGIYVASKIMAERVVRQWRKSWICRVRLPFDGIDHPRNLLTKLAKFQYVVSETQSLTHRGDAVSAMLDMWQNGVEFGTYHLTSPGAVNYLELCDKINLARFNGKRKFCFMSQEVFDATQARTIKSRCVLNTTKLAKAGVKMRHSNEAIDDALTNWREE